MSKLAMSPQSTPPVTARKRVCIERCLGEIFATTQSSHFGNFELVSSQTGKKITRWPTTKNDQQTKQNDQQKMTTTTTTTEKKNDQQKICAKETGIRSVSTNPLLWTLRPPIGPLLGWYSQQRCLWTRCQTSGWVGFDKGKFPTRKRWVGAAPFGKFLRETSKTNG